MRTSALVHLLRLAIPLHNVLADCVDLFMFACILYGTSNARADLFFKRSHETLMSQ